ncbi:hypothetical protein M153_3000003126 [Pseudoloma neurophilia]|uniref:Uncharacterized protein n=1 Tax=Pseudoloma neurophilia TaxID=146866 RepID=A0A0R0LYP3_9MICR|nr:hypothetical protein M153_3000003126 [Pseudoloma neurophilia]
MYEKIINNFIKKNPQVNHNFRINSIKMFILPVIDRFHFLLNNQGPSTSFICNLFQNCVSSIICRKTPLSADLTTFISGIAPIHERAGFVVNRFIFSSKKNLI